MISTRRPSARRRATKAGVYVQRHLTGEGWLWFVAGNEALPAELLAHGFTLESEAWEAAAAYVDCIGGLNLGARFTPLHG